MTMTTVFVKVKDTRTGEYEIHELDIREITPDRLSKAEPGILEY